MNSDPQDPRLEEEPKRTPPKANAYWIYFAIISFISLQYFMTASSLKEVTWNEFVNEMLLSDDIADIAVVNKERVEVSIKPERISSDKYSRFSAKDSGPHYYFTIGSVESFENRLFDIKEEHSLSHLPDIKYVQRVNWVENILSWALPFAIVLGLWIFIIKRIGKSSPLGRGGLGNPFEFGKSRATLVNADSKSKLTFDDVAGLEEAKIEIKEIVEFLKNPDHYTRLGAKIPKGVILVGPPGTGKTLMAKAVAGEANVPFFHISGSEFVEMFVGVGASRVRDLFRKAKEKSPSIIFIDEIDAMGRARGSSLSLRSNDERESTLNQLLAEMDGFGTNTGVIVLAATNRADILDKALLRPGRFDRHIYLDLPNLSERIAIFKVHLRPLTISDQIDTELLAGQTPGFSGADIANICNEAALIAARHGKSEIHMQDFNEAIDRIIAGLEKKSKIISEEEKEIIAYHEAGHATVSWFLKHADTVMKVSIIPRGKSLGASWYLPEEHQIYTRAQLNDRICMALGGRAAEDIVFNEISSGALDDLEKVTKQAYTMIAYYGLDDKLGNISYYDSAGQYDQSLHRPYSEATAEMIDKEVRQLVASSYQRTKAILLDHRKELDQLAKLLVQKELVDKNELEEIFGKRQKDKKVKEIRA